MSQLLSLAADSLSLGMAIFLAAAGLTLLFGILKLLNFAHGSFIMIGAYIACSIIQSADLSLTGFVGVALLAAVAVALLGYLVDLLILTRLRDVDYHYVLIATFALMLVCNGAVKLIWGLDYRTVTPPSVLDQPMAIGSIFISRYSVFLIVAGAVVFAALELAITRLWYGKLMQAIRSDAWMSGLLGLNVAMGLRLSVMAGFFLAGLAGGLLLPNQSLSSEMGDSYLLLAFFAVIIGGLGNIKGAFLASILLGLTSSVNSMFFSAYPGIALYVVLAGFLLVRPNGLFPTLASDADAGAHATYRLAKSVIPRPAWQIVGALVVVALYALPLWADGAVLFLAGTAIIQGLLALSWNLLFGYAGLAAFGHAAFFGVGAYLTGGLSKFYPQIPFLALPVLSALVGAFMALCIGVLALRKLTGIFLAILTIALGEMIRLIVSYNPNLGREDGLVSIPRPKMRFPFAIDLTSPANYYWFMLTLVIVIVAFLWWLVHGRFGRVLLAIRQDAERAAFIGIKVQRFRTIAFMLSGAFAAVAGSLYAPWARIVTLEDLGWLSSVQPVLNSMLGGINSFWGPLLGSAVFTMIGYFTRTLAGLSELIVGLLLLGIILGAPNGIVGFIRTLETRFYRPRGAVDSAWTSVSAKTGNSSIGRA